MVSRESPGSASRKVVLTVHLAKEERREIKDPEEGMATFASMDQRETQVFLERLAGTLSRVYLERKETADILVSLANRGSPGPRVTLVHLVPTGSRESLD